MAIAKDAADWMMSYLEEKKTLYQNIAASHIKTNFGESLIYINENGNPAISQDVLKEFKKLHNGRAKWDRSGSYWELKTK